MSRESLDYAGIEYDVGTRGYVIYKGTNYRAFDPLGNQYGVILTDEYEVVMGKSIPSDLMFLAPVSVTMLVLIKKGI